MFRSGGLVTGWKVFVARQIFTWTVDSTFNHLQNCTNLLVLSSTNDMHVLCCLPVSVNICGRTIPVGPREMLEHCQNCKVQHDKPWCRRCKGFHYELEVSPPVGCKKSPNAQMSKIIDGLYLSK